MLPAEAEAEIKRLAERAAYLLFILRSNKSSTADRVELGVLTERIVELWPVCAESGDKKYLAYLVNTYISGVYRRKYR